MSNILIIKHGSLGDIAQISGALQDIKNFHREDNIYVLTTAPYVDLLSRCPFVDAVIVDKRLARWNLLYILKIRNKIKKFNFSKVYDLQNSSRTSFYRKFLFNIKNWSSSETTLKKGTKKKDFDKNPVLERFDFQLRNSGIKTENCLKPNFSWSTENIDHLIRQYFSNKFILLFPFCSLNLPQKKWPYFNQLIELIKSKHKDLEIAIAPGPLEMNEAKNINATIVINRGEPLNILQLSGLIKRSCFIVSNDTGPAHIAAHLGCKGLALFGHHTSPEKVSIETENFRAVRADKLSDLSAEDVYLKIKKHL